ncbi:MAG TPA: DDE-type integrase/transposase/recombinase [Syntrophomonadaceae bacterium]|nr:DDE-type integrase/transposase/recombinase [Syntrophomonadaceae bacterium]
MLFHSTAPGTTHGTGAIFKGSKSKQHNPPQEIIHHSDRGGQYCSRDYQAALKKYGIICSISQKGNCYDNAYTKIFFSANYYLSPTCHQKEID